MNDFVEPGTLAPTGLFLGGTKYMVIQGEPGVVIRGKKVICSFSFYYFIIIVLVICIIVIRYMPWYILKYNSPCANQKNPCNKGL